MVFSPTRLQPSPNVQWSSPGPDSRTAVYLITCCLTVVDQRPVVLQMCPRPRGRKRRCGTAAPHTCSASRPRSPLETPERLWLQPHLWPRCLQRQTRGRTVRLRSLGAAAGAVSMSSAGCLPLKTRVPWRGSLWRIGMRVYTSLRRRCSVAMRTSRSLCSRCGSFPCACFRGDAVQRTRAMKR